MTDNQFQSALKFATIERQVEDAYNELFKTFFKGVQISYPFQCDGYFEVATEDQKECRVIVEYKYDSNYSNRVEMARTACQMLFYLKKFDQNGKVLPNVCVVADKNECFVFHSNALLKYLDFEGVDWNIAPSAAGAYNPDLLMKISEDAEFNPFVFRINEWFNTFEIRAKILDLAENTQRLIRITEHNIDKIFATFTDRVIIDKKKISPNDLVGIFFGCICDKENYYLHPTKRNTLVSPLGTFKINSREFDSFFSHFSNEVSPKEKLRLSTISDRLIEDTNRRRKGEFYTPTPFVDYAHGMISEALGEDWKEKFVVWDNCCGTKNLTRDYRFKELYCSTLENAELDIASKYNPEAISFQFDFLNDPLEKLPKGLLEAFEQNKKIVFFLNPPYAKNSKIGAYDIGITNISKEMSKEVGSLTTLHCQFLYRIMKIKQKFNLTNCYIGVFCKPILAQTAYKKFRVAFLNEFNFSVACLFNAGYFANVSSAWGISFTIFKSGKDTNITYKHTLIDDKDGEIVNVGIKEIYNVDNFKSAKDWYIESFNEHEKDTEILTGSHPIYFKSNEQNCICQYYSDSLGGFCCSGNNLQQYKFVDLLSVPTKINNVPIFKESFNRFAPYYSARKLIETNWIIDKDEYLAPNESHPKFQEFVNDSIVYSIFSGNQSSLRNINLHDKFWDIKNEFFWMSKSEIESLADEFNNDDCYSDAHTSEDRFVYQKLQEITLSPEAQAVLDKARELVRKSFKFRKLFDEEHPEFQINNWDCGWYQIKAMLKEFMPNELKEFNALFKALADKMRPQVYELGFLRK